MSKMSVMRTASRTILAVGWLVIAVQVDHATALDKALEFLGEVILHAGEVAIERVEAAPRRDIRLVVISQVPLPGAH